MSALAWVRGEQLLALSTEGAEERENAAGRRQSPSTRRRVRVPKRQSSDSRHSERSARLCAIRAVCVLGVCQC